ncbi:MAG: HD domain-containing protein [Phycisphaerales bacterium]|jgi:putative nucleotidyltransferase with HDIG domain|nr:HD domain-containing protein [Phycisphaerales bacterium]
MDPSLLHQLVHAIEGKDLSTAAHTWRVVLYTRAMAEEAGLAHDRIHALTHAAALHDIGKLDTPLEILQKPGRLTDEEFEVIKQHTVTGWARLIKLGIDDEAIVDLVRHHHERVDGTGYPLGLAGDVIPVPARYFAVIDSFDAMTSVRPYRTDVGPEAAARAIRELREGAGSHYCADAVEMFARLYETGRLDFILEHFNDRCAVPEYDASHAIRAHERKRLY